MTDGTVSFQGSCLCGAVRYRTPGPLRPVVGCHCVQCRKTSGHYVAATSAPRETLDIAGEVRWYASSDSARRGFCPVCGSSLFWDGRGSHMSIHAGTLDGDAGIAMIGHIYCADKGSYYELGSDLPCFDGNDAGMTTQVIP